MDVDGAVRRVSGGWVATGVPWTYDAKRYERISAARAAEQQSMLDYETTSGCRMEFLQRALDDDTAMPCGRCDRCAGTWFATEIGVDATAAAAASLDRVGVAVEPRAQWPRGMDRLGIDVRGNIPIAERTEPGRALARLTDLGWGGTLRELFAPDSLDARASPALISACVRVLADWSWQERPVAVVSMPSRRHPLLIASVAEGIAAAGKLPYFGALDLIGGGPLGEPGGNSAYRLAGVWQRFAAADLILTAGRDPAAGFDLTSGPVLLVDDLADSRWTLTVAGRELRRAGTPAVLPFVLALRA
jgi:ATP-dependent DNA helicase RecQ